MRFSTWDDLREAMPSDLPWAIRESILGNVVVGNFSDHFAVSLGLAISRCLRQSSVIEQSDDGQGRG